MTSTISALRIRKALGRDTYLPPEPFGPDGWRFTRKDRTGSVIVSAAPFDGTDWIHASIAYADRLPTYEDLTLLHRAAFPGYAIQVFAPPRDHISIHPNALHLWGRADGKASHPNFGQNGTI